MGFRENLKTELSYSGILVKELAAKTGLSKHTIENYLSVRGRMPSAEVAVRIARVLGVSVEYLVTGNKTGENDGYTRLSSISRRIAGITEKLNPNSREMALALVETLKKLENTQSKN